MSLHNTSLGSRVAHRSENSLVWTYGSSSWSDIAGRHKAVGNLSKLLLKWAPGNRGNHRVIVHRSCLARFKISCRSHVAGRDSDPTRPHAHRQIERDNSIQLAKHATHLRLHSTVSQCITWILSQMSPSPEDVTVNRVQQILSVVNGQGVFLVISDSGKNTAFPVF